MASTNKKLTLNALSAIIQVLFTAILYFFLYKFLLGTLGVKQLGVWSLILSFSSIANLANLGLTSGLVKFVAEYIAENDHEKTGKLILTSTISLTALFLFISILVFFVAKPLLHFFVEEKFLHIALSILPLSLGSLTISGIGGVYTSVLEGYQKNYLRNFVFILSGVLMFTTAFILTPSYQLQGIAIAQILQSIFVLVASAILVIKISPDNSISKWKWSTSSFKEIFEYGYKFQVVSICQLLYEPTTKMLLSKFGGLSLLGHYEMASKLINQFRALMVNANQVVIPIVAETAKAKKKEDSIRFYTGMNRIMVLFSLPLTVLLIAITPLLSTLWIGSNDLEFNYSMYILAASSILNILCSPAYFSCIGEARLNMLIKTHISMAVLNLLLSPCLGLLWGGNGIILGWGISLSAGSVYLIWKYNQTLNVRFSAIYSKQELDILFLSIILLGLFFFVQGLYTSLIGVPTITLFCLSTMLLFIPILIKNQRIQSFINNLKRK